MGQRSRKGSAGLGGSGALAWGLLVAVRGWVSWDSGAGGWLARHLSFQVLSGPFHAASLCEWAWASSKVGLQKQDSWGTKWKLPGPLWPHLRSHFYCIPLVTSESPSHLDLRAWDKSSCLSERSSYKSHVEAHVRWKTLWSSLKKSSLKPWEKPD